MGRKKAEDIKPIEAELKTAESPLEPETPAAFIERADDSGAQIKRISIKVNSKGGIDFEGMRDATKKDLKSVIQATSKEPDGAKNLGLKAEEIPLVVPPEFCMQLYDAVGRLESMIAQRGMGIDQDIADGTFTYTQEEKKLLAMPTAVVISKYSPETVGKYKEEIQLAVLLGGITFAKFSNAKQLQAARVEAAKTRTAVTQ